MRRVTEWLIGGLVTMALWVPGAGAQDNRHRYQAMDHNRPALRQGGNYGALPANREGMHRDHMDLRTDHQNAWRGMPQDRGNVWHDRWDRRAGNHEALRRDWAAIWRDRAQLRADHWKFWYDWRNRRHDYYNRW